MYQNDTTADAPAFGRSVFETASDLVAGLPVLGGLVPGRGTEASDGDPLSAILRERNEEYIAIEVWFPEGISDELEPLNEVYLGDAEQFVVRHDEDTVSLPEEPEQLATPVGMESLGTEDRMHGKLMYFRTGDVDWPTGHVGVGVTLAVGAFPGFPIWDGNLWDTTPGIYADLRDVDADYITVEARLPDGMEPDDVDFADDVFLGYTGQFLVDGEAAAVSLPPDTDGLATPAGMDFGNPHDLTVHFRTEDVALSNVADFGGPQWTEMGFGVFPERTVPADRWDTVGTFDPPGRFDTGLDR